MLKLPDVRSPSEAVFPTIPFSEVKLYAADYYAGVAMGSVAGSHSKWSRLASSRSSGTIPSGLRGMVGGTIGGMATAAVAQSDIVNKLKEFKNNLIVYRGPIEFEIQKDLSLHPAGPGTNYKSDGKGTEKEVRNRGTVNDPLGMFTIKGLEFEPGQKVKARIIVEGFVIESDWVETDGLIVSEIDHESLKINTGLKYENYSADNSFVIVSAMRSDKTPAGNVKLLKGAGAPHSSLIGYVNVSQFPEAVKAKIWFDNEVSLNPLPGHPGSAIAETGEWSVDYNYLSAGDIMNPAKHGMHPFELVSYIYKGKELGYAYFINECNSCSAVANVVKKFDLPNKRFNKALDQTIAAPATVPKTQPVVKPVIIK